MSIGNLQVGSAVVMSGSANVKNTMGSLLGFLCTTAGSCSIYDSSTNTTTAPIVTSYPLAVGWNAIPVTFQNGCYITLSSAAGSVVIA